MTEINGSAALGGVAGVASGWGAGNGALAEAALAGLVSRMAGWSALVSGGSAEMGVALDRLRHGGDIHGVREMAATLAAATGATPAEEGRLLRAIEEVAREAAVRMFGLAGAGEAVQLADIGEAMAAAGDAGSDAEGMINYFEKVREALASLAALAQATQPNSW